MGHEAWVTSAVEDGAVAKALILAGSLRRVRTARKSVVLTTLAVSETLREKLKDVFDLVLLLEQKSSNGLCLEDYAKVQAFSLLVFDKCVYLSPNTMVMRNCDDIFASYDSYAAAHTGANNDIDSSVFLYTPSQKYSRLLKKIWDRVDGADYPKDFDLWLKNNIPMIEELDQQYNMRINLNGNGHQGLNLSLSIVNFADFHPLDLSEKIRNSAGLQIGTLEKFFVDQCWSIYEEDVKRPELDCPWISQNAQYRTEPIAIVGMSFRLPGANNVDEFWSLLAEGKSAIVPVPSHRWTKEHSYSPCKNRKVEAGFLNVPVDEFDSKFFGLSPKEVEFLDPQQRLLMEVTWEALEDAMIDPLKLRGTQTGVFVGSWIHDYKDMLSRSTDCDFFRTYMGNSIGSSAARLSHFLETTGPSIATESGCSSAIAAVDIACKSLRNGTSSIAVAAGTNLLLHPFETDIMEYVLSPDFRSKTFDAGANGFARAEGIAVLLLKRLSDAAKDGDKIWGLIRGTALTQEGISKSLGTPTVHCESLAMENALKDAGVDPNAVSYVEVHGTGTPVGDPMEILAINKAYSKGRTDPLLIGSVKTNVGHTESVSGITGIIKVLLSMKNEVIPRHLNFTKLNPNINLDAIPAYIPLSPVPWPRKDKPRIAGVSSFGISGTDGHAIIEEAPRILRNELVLAQERPLHILKMSAKSIESMHDLIEKYLNISREKINNNEDSEKDFANLAYSANIGRATFNHRAVLTARNFQEAEKILREKSFKETEVQSSGSNLCFLFSGQGSQYPNMAKQLYETSPVFQSNFDKCDHVLQRRYSISIKDILWSGGESNEELSRTLYSQTSIFVVEYCLLKLWESWGVKPDYVMGHSLGEFAAAVAAGAIDFEDALMLVAERSRLIDQLPRGKMLVIKADKKSVDETIAAFQKIQPNFWVDYAAINSQEQTVVAGDSEMIEGFSKFCEEKSLKTIVLASTHAFHSRHMDPILESYRMVAATCKKPHAREDVPKFISGVEGSLCDMNSIDAEYWVKHTRESVRFMDACRVIEEEGCTLFVEIGPHPVLSALTMMNMDRNGRQVTCLPSIRRKEDEWVTMLDSLSKLYLSNWKGEIDWKGFDRHYNRGRVKLPFYPFNRKSIWPKMDSELAKVHPLIGRLMQTCWEETIFQNSMSLKNTNFAQDHVIGNTVIFPGAGFLEMCLAGGHSTVQGLTDFLLKPRRPIVLKSLKISSPMALHDTGPIKVQTMVALNDNHDIDNDEELGYSLGIFRHAETEDIAGAGKWIQHASAKFLPMASLLPKPLSKPTDIFQIQSSWEETDNRDFYETLPEVGLRFGPLFQSLQNGWKSEEGMMASVKVPQDFKNYLIHPVIADAMIQAIMLWTSKDKVKKKLQVPVQIGEFMWLKEAETLSQFVYCSNDENNTAYCILVDESGFALAYMKGVDFIETSVKLVEGMITQQHTSMPQLWTGVWKPSRGPMQGYMTHEVSLEDMDFSREELELHQEENKITEDEKMFYNNLVKLTRFSILKALYTLGWEPEINRVFSVNSLLESLNIKGNFSQHIQFFLRSLAKEDIKMVEIVDEEEMEFKFVMLPPSLEELENGLKCVSSSRDYSREEYLIIMELDKSLSKILTGDIIPLSILFPEDCGKPSAKKLYSAHHGHMSTRPAKSKTRKHFKSAAQSYKTPQLCRPVYRVLEIGAGTAAFSNVYVKGFLPEMQELNVDLEYHFTDITSAFFKSAEEELKEYRNSVIFKKYDMELDPLEQGFCPGYFDAITASEVFHIAKDIKKTMKSVRALLKPGGLITFYETIYPTETITYIFGLLDGYWQFKDKEFRKYHTTLTPHMWKEAMTQAGFCGVSVTPMYNSMHGAIAAHAAPLPNNFLMDLRPPINSWIIFGKFDDFSERLKKKFRDVNRKCLIFPMPVNDISEEIMKACMKNAIAAASEEGFNLEGVLYLWSLSPETRDQAKVSLPFVTLMKLISESQNRPKIFPVTRGLCAVESSEVVDPTPGTIVGFCKSLGNENPSLSAQHLDLDPSKSAMDQIDELFMNLWVDHKQGAAFRDGQRLSSKITAAKIKGNEPLTLPSGCDRFQLVLPKTRLISDLEFAYLQPYTLGEKDVEIQVKATALNFRDVLTILKPIQAFENFNAVGLDFAGVIVKTGAKVTRVKVGDRVAGMSRNDSLSLPSHYKIGENYVVPISNSMTLEEAVTLPAVLSTALYCLIRIGKIKRGESVLIHTASGGVGLVAIQLCKYIGANVIATAGSQRKRTYLRNLGIEHVFHSRNTDFKENILEATGGCGVDVVLNSITGPGFKEASLAVLGRNGRFIEMSKLNTWTKEEVKMLRPDVFYELVDLTLLDPQESESLVESLKSWMEAGSIKPIPYERFDALNIRGALNYLQKAKHIGKIVCVMPEVKLDKSKLVVSTPLFNGESTYLVTGGLGGIGLEVVKWMLHSGAVHIAIASRSNPKPEIADQIETWNKTGKHVKAFSVDVANYDKLKSLFGVLKKPELGFPQIRGVMHVAGVLHDAVLENQSWDKFIHTYNPKVNGSWNLHDLTKEYLLEHFVLFSSMAATFGSPGQTNHSASNSFEESLAAYRRSNGLPATCINWGNWGEVGVATEIDFPGLRPISTVQGLMALETFLKTQTNHMNVLNVESFSLMLKLFPQVKHCLGDHHLLGEVKTLQIINCDDFWNEVDSAEGRKGKVDCFKKFIKITIRNMLKMDADEPIQDHTELQTLGVDSLMMLELKNGIQNILGHRLSISASQLKDCNTTEILANTLVDALMQDTDSAVNKLPSNEELKQLIREDSNLLPETLSTDNLTSKSIEDVETVLLTGATGFLGPYLLTDLISREQIKMVYCLVRPTRKVSGLERLRSKLKEMKLNGTVNMSKVKVIEGDITTPRFGLTDDIYFSLCEKIDAIVHSAVKSDHISKYWKAPESNTSHVRTVNVLGTVRLLEFAAEKTLKHFFYGSTILAFTGTGKDGQFTEGWQDVSAFDDNLLGSFGYVISKHISEQLVQQAQTKGIPCKAFRFPVISGNSNTGRIDYQQNHSILRWLTCMKVGAIHDIPAPFTIMAVDHCAKISLDIFFNPDAPMSVYNIIQKSLEIEQVLVEVAHTFGIEMETVSYEHFMEKLKAEDEKSPISTFVKMYAEEEAGFISMFENPSSLALKKYFEDGSGFLDTTKLAKYAPEYENLVESASQVLRRDFAYLKSEGVFDKYGIETSS